MRIRDWQTIFPIEVHTHLTLRCQFHAYPQASHHSDRHAPPPSCFAATQEARIPTALSASLRLFPQFTVVSAVECVEPMQDELVVFPH